MTIRHFLLIQTSISRQPNENAPKSDTFRMLDRIICTRYNQWSFRYISRLPKHSHSKKSTISSCSGDGYPVPSPKPVCLISREVLNVTVG